MSFDADATGIEPADIGTDEKLARSILVEARLLAPWLRTVRPETEAKADAVAILDRVYKRAVDIGTGVVASQGRNGTSRSTRDIRDAFFPADIRGLRSLDPNATTGGAPAGMPIGSFPTDRPLSRLFPEGPYG